jgi:hypothetical protein
MFYMAKPRQLTLLATLALLITTASIVGHFVNDTLRTVPNTVNDECAATQVSDGCSNAISPLTADLHSNFNLPSNPPPLSLIALAFILAVATLIYLPYSPAPASPPPKLLS